MPIPNINVERILEDAFPNLADDSLTEEQRQERATKELELWEECASVSGVVHYTAS